MGCGYRMLVDIPAPDLAASGAVASRSSLPDSRAGAEDVIRPGAVMILESTGRFMAGFRTG